MYRDSASQDGTLTTFPLRPLASAGTRTMVVVLGLVLFSIGALSLWFNSETRLTCKADSRTCVIQQDFLFHSGDTFTYGPNKPVKFFVEKATIGKNGRGEALVLATDNGGRVTIARGYSVAQQVRAIEAFSQDAKSDLTLAQPRDWGLFVVMGLMPALVGLLFLLSPLVRARHYLIADPQRRIIALEFRVFGLVRQRAEIPIASSRIALGTTHEFHGRPSRAQWLTLLPDGDAGEAKHTGLVDTPLNRDALHEALRLIQEPTFKSASA